MCVIARVITIIVLCDIYCAFSVFQVTLWLIFVYFFAQTFTFYGKMYKFQVFLLIVDFFCL